MIEQILKGKNIRSACKQVMSNKGSAGVDGMTVKELPEYLKSIQKDLCTRILTTLFIRKVRRQPEELVTASTCF